jgi:hypothetical protein
VDVFDRVSEGVMPPNDADQPATSEKAAFISSLRETLARPERARTAVNGRATRRRLNRYEYENVMRDLLGTPWLQLKDLLPEDPEAYHYNKSGEALDISHLQMTRYLDAGEFALQAVMAKQVERPQPIVKRYYARDQKSFLRHMYKYTNEQERCVIPVLDYDVEFGIFENRQPKTVGESDPETREREGFVEIASQYESYMMWFDSFKAPSPGLYKLRFKTFTAWIGPSSLEYVEPGMQGVEDRWWIPDLGTVSKGRRTESVSVYADSLPSNYRLIGRFESQPEPTVHEMEAYLLEGESIHPDIGRFFRTRHGAGRWRNPLATPEGSPGVGFRWLEVEGPIIEQWPTEGHRLLFGDLRLRPIKNPGIGEVPLEVVSENPTEDAQRLLRNFISRAYRHPVLDSEVQRFLPVYEGVVKSGGRFADAMIAAYLAVLCSPEFLTLQANPGPLDSFALSERLAFFLQNTAPDSELRELAAKGELTNPAVLRGQVDRLLDSPKSTQFINAFTDYWLDLRKIDGSAPDPILYNDYYLDDLLKESALEETQAFVTELIRKDIPVCKIVDSDFAMVNESLAAHYGFPHFEGGAIRRVPVPEDSPRGGLITQASIMKVTTNGMTTSPVKRGAWIMDRILGKPPAPPPPAVSAVEPDTRGATTIREQLEQHRNDASCAACHKTMDPPGFALESFDVMGGWRERYRAFNEDAKPYEGLGHGGQKLQFHYALPVDASGEMADGNSFADFNEFKALLLRDETQIARNITGQLVVYATGTPVRFSDRPEIEKILDRAALSQYGFRSLIHEVVQSQLFLQK